MTYIGNSKTGVLKVKTPVLDFDKFSLFKWLLHNCLWQIKNIFFPFAFCYCSFFSIVVINCSCLFSVSNNFDIRFFTLFDKSYLRTIGWNRIIFSYFLHFQFAFHTVRILKNIWIIIKYYPIVILSKIINKNTIHSLYYLFFSIRIYKCIRIK